MPNRSRRPRNVVSPKIAMSGLPHEKLVALTPPVEEFLVASTMAISALFSLLAWNTILPDRRDCLVLGLLPAVLMDSINFSVITLLSRGGG